MRRVVLWLLLVPLLCISLSAASCDPGPTQLPPFLVCVRWRESRNNYQAYNPSSGASGAFQFLQVTWNNTAKHAGRWDLVGIQPRWVVPWDQDAMAVHLYLWQGTAPWGGYCY